MTTEIPDKIVSQVARAIGDSGIEGARLRRWIQLPSELTDENTDKLLQMAARAALTASGWAEMREALKNLLHIAQGWGGYGMKDEAIADAKKALQVKP